MALMFGFYLTTNQISMTSTYNLQELPSEHTTELPSEH
jgi:hypothetical protein